MAATHTENLAEELKDSGLIFRPGALNLLVQEAQGDAGLARQIASNLKASEWTAPIETFNPRGRADA